MTLAELAERCRNSFLEFYRWVAWPILEGRLPLIESYYLHSVCDHLQVMATTSQINWLAICAPPGIGKSGPVSKAFPAWLWQLDPSIGVLSFSRTQGLASHLCGYTRKILGHPLYRYLFPHVEIDPKHDNANEFRTTAGGERRALGVDAGIGFRAWWGILDDIQSRKEARSEVESAATWNSVKGEVIQRINSTEDRPSKLVSNQQRLSKMDVTAHLIEHYGNKIDLLCFQQRRVFVDVPPIRFDDPAFKHTPGESSTALTRAGKWIDPRVEGELLSPRQFTEADAKREEKDLRDWSALHLQAPIAEAADDRKLKNYNSNCHWDASAVVDARPGSGWYFRLAVDYGSGAGKHIMGLIAGHPDHLVLGPVMGLIDEHVPEPGHTVDQNANAFRALIARWPGLTLRRLQDNRGDTNKDLSTAKSLNSQYSAALDGIIIGTPDKKAGSVDHGTQLMDRGFQSGGLKVDPKRCPRTDQSLQVWTGGAAGKDACDMFRYGTIEQLEEWFEGDAGEWVEL